MTRNNLTELEKEKARNLAVDSIYQSKAIKYSEKIIIGLLSLGCSLACAYYLYPVLNADKYPFSMAKTYSNNEKYKQPPAAILYTGLCCAGIGLCGGGILARTIGRYHNQAQQEIKLQRHRI